MSSRLTTTADVVQERRIRKSQRQTYDAPTQSGDKRVARVRFIGASNDVRKATAKFEANPTEDNLRALEVLVVTMLDIGAQRVGVESHVEATDPTS
jgi:hypothetical protein